MARILTPYRRRKRHLQDFHLGANPSREEIEQVLLVHVGAHQSSILRSSRPIGFKITSSIT